MYLPTAASPVPARRATFNVTRAAGVGTRVTFAPLSVVNVTSDLP
jgi:hypothetical protein